MSIGPIGSLRSSLSSVDAQPSFVRAQFHARRDAGVTDTYTPQAPPTSRSGAGSAASYTFRPSPVSQPPSSQLIPTESKSPTTGPRPLPPEASKGAGTTPPVAPPVPLPPQRVDSGVGPVPLPPQRVDSGVGPVPLPSQRVDSGVGPVPLPAQRVDSGAGPVPLPAQRVDSGVGPEPLPAQRR